MEHCPPRCLIVYLLKAHLGHDYWHLLGRDTSLPIGICKWNILLTYLLTYLQMKPLDRKPARILEIEISSTTYLWVTRAVHFNSRQFCTSKVQILLFHRWLAASPSGHRVWSRLHEYFWKPEVRPWAVEREDMRFLVDACENAGDIIFQKGEWKYLDVTCGNKEKRVRLQWIFKTI